MRKVSSLLGLLGLLVAGGSAWAGPVPEDVRELVRLERMYNMTQPVGRRVNGGQFAFVAWPALAEDDSTTEKIFYYDLPAERVAEDNVFRSKYMDAPLIGLVEPKPGTIRVFVAESNADDRAELERDYGKTQPDGYLEGIRIQGRSTYIVWRPDDLGGRKWQLKFGIKVGRSDDGRRNVRALGRATIQRSVAMSDIVEEILTRESSGTRVGFLPERFGVSLGNYGYLVREMQQVGMRFEPGTAYAVPLHGFLSKEMHNLAAVTSKYPRRPGESGPQAWIAGQYIPVLSEALAELLLYLGIVAELHTQNIKLVLGMNPHTQEPTGELLGILFTDACDVAIDPSIRILFRRHPYVTELSRMASASQMGSKVMGEAVFADHAQHLFAFMSQSLGAAAFFLLNADAVDRGRAELFEELEARVYHAFLFHFLDVAQRYFTAIGLSTTAAMTQMKAAVVHELRKPLPPPRVALPAAERAAGDRPERPLTLADMGPIDPNTRGQRALALLSGMVKLLVGDTVKATVIHHLAALRDARSRQLQRLINREKEKQRRKPPANRGGGKIITLPEIGEDDHARLKEEFLTRHTYKHAAFLDPSHAEQGHSLLIDPATRFVEIEGIGIVAYRDVAHGGSFVPVVFAIAPAYHVADDGSCAIALTADRPPSPTVVWSNRSVPAMIEMDRLLHGLLGN